MPQPTVALYENTAVQLPFQNQGVLLPVEFFLLVNNSCALSFFLGNLRLRGRSSVPTPQYRIQTVARLVGVQGCASGCRLHALGQR